MLIVSTEDFHSLRKHSAKCSPLVVWCGIGSESFGGRGRAHRAVLRLISIDIIFSNQCFRSRRSHRCRTGRQKPGEYDEWIWWARETRWIRWVQCVWHVTVATVSVELGECDEFAEYEEFGECVWAWHIYKSSPILQVFSNRPHWSIIVGLPSQLGTPRMLACPRGTAHSGRNPGAHQHMRPPSDSDHTDRS